MSHENWLAFFILSISLAVWSSASFAKGRDEQWWDCHDKSLDACNKEAQEKIETKKLFQKDLDVYSAKELASQACSKQAELECNRKTSFEVNADRQATKRSSFKGNASSGSESSPGSNAGARKPASVDEATMRSLRFKKMKELERAYPNDEDRQQRELNYWEENFGKF